MASWLHPLIDLAASTLAPAGKRSRLTILIYHRVRPEPDALRPGECDQQTFRWQMELLSRHYRVLPLHEAWQRLARGTLPARAACITFDDGYADNEAIALPILQHYGLPATFFVATGFLDGGRMWNDTVIEWARNVEADEIDLSDYGLGAVRPNGIESRRKLIADVIGAIKYLEPSARSERVAQLVERVPTALPDDLMMTSAQVKHLAESGMEVGGHTHSHPILASLDTAQARREIVEGKERLEAIVGSRLRLFAYPNGKPGVDYLSRDRDLVQSLGFDAAVSTEWGAADRTSDRFQLPRFTPWHRTPLKFHLALLRNYLWRAEPAESVTRAPQGNGARA